MCMTLAKQVFKSKNIEKSDLLRLQKEKKIRLEIWPR